jgi:SPBc2 prophage-derived putative HNH homing endonuclease yosQ
MLIKEEYKTLPWAKNYKVSNTGKVFSFAKIKLGIELKPVIIKNKRAMSLGKDLYPYVSISDNNKKIRNYNIHRLVAETFIPNPENKPMVNHIDGDKTNNRVNNLEWVTPKENIQHAVKEGLMNPPIGERCASSKYKESQVLEAIKLLSEGKPNCEVAKLTGINDRAVSDIRNKKRWGYLWDTDQTKGLTIPDGNNGQYKPKIPLETRIEIIKDAEYYAPSDLIKKYGICSSVATKIRQGKYWKDARDIINNTQQ